MTRHIVALGATLFLLALGAPPASAQQTGTLARAPESLDAAASWHGRPIRRPDRTRFVRTAAGYPLGWTAGAVRPGTGYGPRIGSDRVRDVQRRLWALGYRPGPVDGRLGPRTAAAIRAFEVKHGLKRDGVVNAATLERMRTRLASPREASGRAEAQTKDSRLQGTPAVGRQSRAASAQAAVQQAPIVQASPVGSEDEGSSVSARWTMGLLALLVVVIVVIHLRVRRTRMRHRRPAATSVWGDSGNVYAEGTTDRDGMGAFRGFVQAMRSDSGSDADLMLHVHDANRGQPIWVRRYEVSSLRSGDTTAPADKLDGPKPAEVLDEASRQRSRRRISTVEGTAAADARALLQEVLQLERGGLTVDSHSSVQQAVTLALTRMLNERHPGLGDHVEGVADLAAASAEALGLSPDDVRLVRRAAELHDIGKVSIPAEILATQGPLDRRYREFMRRHTVIGERILAGVLTLDEAAALVRSSHERWDGNGYPDRLTGEEIPLGSRIIHVADAYCAMTENRPYAQTQTQESARRQLRACSGTQFDPAVVAASLEALERRNEGEVARASIPALSRAVA